MHPKKLKTRQAFGARKCSMKLVRMARLSFRPCVDDDRTDSSCRPALASSAQDSGCIDASSNASPAPPSPEQKFVVISAPVSSSSTAASTSLPSASDSAIVSSTVHLQTCFLTCEEEAADKKRAAVQR
ncbi:hypothetical protein HPB50_007890 [Hyalomma asiaticum]|uniref:Uncharacterized protein n=1 Tax=Hyalomma asiaticum TaxID=266040 RepID=A0ACB7RSI8_HYAAI|nr:hypothetical protein HPB50_007890 [Hyalomma asiaticum]